MKDLLKILKEKNVLANESEELLLEIKLIRLIQHLSHNLKKCYFQKVKKCYHTKLIRQFVNWILNGNKTFVA